MSPRALAVRRRSLQIEKIFLEIFFVKRKLAAMSASTSHSTSLPRVLGPWIAIAIVVGTVIGSGVFKKPSAVAKDVPEFSLAIGAWVLGGVLAMLGALALAEVATLFPRAGGNYVFLREGYGRLAGFLWGWVDFWIIRTGSIAALATIFAESIHDAIRQARDLPADARVFNLWVQHIMAVAVIMGLALINVRGVKWGGMVQLVITIIKVSTLVGVILLPFVVLGFVSEPKHPPSVANLNPVWPADWGGVSLSKFGAAMVGVIWAYHGWMNIGPVAEEVKEPRRNLPLALIAGVGVVIVLYVGANIAYYLVIPSSQMTELGKTTVATAFSTRLIGSVGGIITALAIAISVFGALNGNILVGPRLLYAMGEDGLAPRWLSGVHERFKTPAVATLVMSGWAALMVILVALWIDYPLRSIDLFGSTINPNPPPNKTGFDVITDFAMFGAIALETLAVMAIIPLRILRPNLERPYRCLGYPVVPVLYGLVMLLVWLNMFAKQTTESLVGIAFMGAGAVVYLAFLRRP